MQSLLTPLGISRRYAIALVLFFLMVEGIVGSMFYHGSLPLFFFYYKVSVSEYQKALVLGMIPWNTQPLWGVLSDLFPLLGTHKRTYTVAALCGLPFAILGVVLSLVAESAYVFMTFVSLCIAVPNIMFVGQYATMILLGKATQKVAPFTQALVMSGAIVGILAVGGLADTEKDAHRIVYGYIACIFLVIPALYYVVMYPREVFEGDRAAWKNSGELSERLNRPQDDIIETVDIRQRSKPTTPEIILAAVMTATSVVLLIVVFNMNETNAYASFGVAIVLTVAILCYVFRVYASKRRLAKLCVFACLHEVLYIDIMGAMDVFYTAPDVCIPSGPAFGLMFYVGWTKLIAYTISLVMMGTYMKWAVGWRTRTTVLLGVTLRIFSSVTDIILAKHWNREAGISDTSAFLLGDGMVNLPCSKWTQLALILATTKLLVEGREALTTAIVVGLQFTGQSVSKIVGLLLINLYGIQADMTTGTCNFDGYPALLVAAHIVAPMFLYPAAYALLD